MDGDIHLVVVGIGDADHLLIGIAGGHTHQTGKATDTEVDMHDIVAGLHLAQLLHGESHLTRAGHITAEIIFMITVEDLMIGEETESQHVIGKTLMDGLVYRHKLNMLMLELLTGKDVQQTLLLFLTIGKDIQLISLQHIVLQCIGEQLEILMEERLWGDITFNGGLWRIGGLTAELYPSERLHILRKSAAAQQHTLCLELFHEFLLLHLCLSLQPFGDSL